MLIKTVLIIASTAIALSGNLFAGGYPSNSSSNNMGSNTNTGMQSSSTTSNNKNLANNTNYSNNLANKQPATTYQRNTTSRGPADQGFDAVENDELIIDTASIIDGDGMGSIQVQWQLSEDGDIWLIMPGAIQPSFVPRDSEVGKYLRVQISYVDGQGNT